MKRSDALALERRIQRTRAELLPDVLEGLCDLIESDPLLRDVRTAKLVAHIKAYVGPSEQVDEPQWISRMRRTVAKYEARAVHARAHRRTRSDTDERRVHRTRRDLSVFDLENKR